MYSITTNKILFYPCTLVGYVRLLLLGSAIFLVFTELDTTLALQVGVGVLMGLSLLLDSIDGYLARKFGHTTQFGTLFDLVIDLISHTFIWMISDVFFASGLIILEWTAGLYIAAFSMKPNTHWKRALVDQGPALVNIYFGRNQRNVLSAYGNISHFILPVTFYLEKVPAWIGYTTLPGLILYEVVTLYVLFILMKILVSNP